MDGWLLGQVSTVLTALSHAQELFDGAGRPTLPTNSRRAPTFRTTSAVGCCDAPFRRDHPIRRGRRRGPYPAEPSQWRLLRDAFGGNSTDRSDPERACGDDVAVAAQLQDIQRQLIEAINNPVAALDTPAGERHFLMFLRSKIAEIQDIVDTGALTDEDHAKLTRALGSGYLLPTSGRDGSVPPAPYRRARR